MTNVNSERITIEVEIKSLYGEMLSKASSVNSEVNEQLNQWHRQTKRHLEIEFPYYEQEKFIELSRLPKVHLTNFNKLIKIYKQLCKDSNSHFNKFWNKELEKFNKIKMKVSSNGAEKQDLENSFALLAQECQKRLDELRVAWELEQLSVLRTEFLKALFEKLALLQELFTSLDTLGLDPGIFFDLSSGSLSLGQIESIKMWVEYLRNDQGVLHLLKLMGRVNQAKQSEKIEIIKKTVSQLIPLPDINSKEEIVGIRLGKDIEHALPSELALIADPDTSILFDLKYLESGLMCFDMEGIKHIEHEYEVELEQTVVEDETKGPMIICVDTSGSMQGAPETIAKAVTMLMVLKAKQDDRDCYLINFSTGIEILDLSGGFAMENLMSFLQKSFHCGTDVAPAISHGISVMETDTYKNADMLIISDFIMAGLPSTLLNKIEKLRGVDNKFNSLVVNSCFMEHRLKTIFDHEWVYDPDTSGVVELLGFEKKM